MENSSQPPGTRSRRVFFAAGLFNRLRGLLVGLFGMSLLGAPAPQAAAQAAVPQHWISYAQLVSNQFQAWLANGENEAVVRLHTHLQQRVLNQADVPYGPTIVRVWVADDGQVSRVEFDSLGDPAADADLRGILTAQPLSEPPPRDMRQPMVLRLKLDFAA